MRLLKDLVIDAGEIGSLNEDVVRAQMMSFLSPPDLINARFSMAELIVASWDVRGILGDVSEGRTLEPRAWRRRFNPGLVEREIEQIRKEVGAPIPFLRDEGQEKSVGNEDAKKTAEILLRHVLAYIGLSVSTTHVPDEVVYVSMVTGLAPLDPQYLRRLCLVTDIVTLAALAALEIVDGMLRSEFL